MKAAKRADGSVRRARGVFLEMQAKFTQTSASALTTSDAKAWIDSLIKPHAVPAAGRAQKRTAFTVGNVWLATSKAVFNWAVDQQQIASNPFASVKVTKQRRTRERPNKTFTKEEIATILSACQQVAGLKKPLERAKRWVPLLCAYSGARVGEMTQLRKEDVKKLGATYFAYLVPSAGTIKDKQARIVPLHEHLIELGFIKFVEKCGPGPMFYKPSISDKVREDDPLNPKRGPAVKARENLGQWESRFRLSEQNLRVDKWSVCRG